MEAVLLSLGREVPHDPVLRDNRGIDLLFEIGELEIILRHNLACLEGTLEILLFSYFPENVLENGF